MAARLRLLRRLLDGSTFASTVSLIVRVDAFSLREQHCAVHSLLQVCFQINYIQLAETLKASAQ
eukprot:2885988-Pyramimonas_sp.AAC.1